MPDLQGLDAVLLELVERLDVACLFEAVQPGALEQLIPSRSSAFQEPPPERFVHVARAAAITLGRVTTASRGDIKLVCRVVTGFRTGQLAGLGALASCMNHEGADLVVRRAKQFERLLVSEAGVEKSFRSDDAKKKLGHMLPARVLLHHVACALASALGTLAKLHGWTADDVTSIIMTAHEGVLAGEAARHDEGARR